MFIFLDTETTGNRPEDRICQIAFKSEKGPATCELFNPGLPISIDAMSIHHITNEMVADKPAFKGSEACNKLTDLVAGEKNVIVAHNARFDIGMLQKEGINPPRHICTLKLSRYLDKNGVIPKYNLQYLRYYLDLKVDAKPHDALGDVQILEALFNRIYAKFEGNGTTDIAEEMIRISNSPILIPRMPFGKHRGKLFSEIPMDYLGWLSGTDLDEDLKYTVQHHLGSGV